MLTQEPDAVGKFLIAASTLWSTVWRIAHNHFALIVVAAARLFLFMLVSAIFSVWLERKVAGRIQDRLGPTRVGGKFGWLPTPPHGIELVGEREHHPRA